VETVVALEKIKLSMGEVFMLVSSIDDQLRIGHAMDLSPFTAPMIGFSAHSLKG
jgi:hypothetical protein